jgi:DNA end-binding protein Ku
MQQAGVAAVGRFVLWGKENLCLIRPLDETLALELLYYAEDIRSRDEIVGLVAQTEVRDPELAMARQLVDSLVGEFDPEAFANDYRRALRAMLEAKLDGQEISRPEPAEPAPVIDLMEALRQSVAQAEKEKAPAKRPSSRRSRAKT